MARFNSLWWGPPKKFSLTRPERKISWLELFYDLVYAITISKTTTYLEHHITTQGILDYVYLFVMIFWGWYNGSLYYDLHGAPGVRTRLMTLWQMMSVAALAATMGNAPDALLHDATICIMVLQAYITYVWWSVGLYDKEHRRLNVPYTICYLSALALMAATLYVPQPYKRILFGITLVLNFMPPFLFLFTFGKRSNPFNISSSMVERLGLLTIIVFGEAILGVVNSLENSSEINLNTWLCFGMGILIVFVLWWIFFAITADRECKEGFLHGQIMSFIYIPTLASLGMIGTGFPALMATAQQGTNGNHSLPEIIYGISISIFLYCIAVLTNYLEFPPGYRSRERRVKRALLLSSAAILIITIAFYQLTIIQYLAIVFFTLAIIISILVRIWYVIERDAHDSNIDLTSEMM